VPSLTLLADRVEDLTECLECHFSIGRRFGVTKYEEWYRAEMKQAAACKRRNWTFTALKVKGKVRPLTCQCGNTEGVVV
jgi:hypothetical protein